jgi:ubiquitin-conjugating enzyme E2 variant
VSAAGRRPAWLVALDAASLATFAAASALLLARLEQLPPPAWWPALCAAALLGVCAADLATGAVHWLFDGFFDERTPILGRAFVQPFREHHRDPAAIARHGLLEVSGNDALALCPLLWLCAAYAGDFGRGFAATLLLAFALAAITAGLVANQVHRWAHAPRAPRGVRWMQRHRWILSPQEHARHHRGAHDRAFCVATGWMNPLLDRLVAWAPGKQATRPGGVPWEAARERAARASGRSAGFGSGGWRRVRRRRSSGSRGSRAAPRRPGR